MELVILQPSILFNEAPVVDDHTWHEQKLLQDLVAEHSKQDRERMHISDVIPVGAPGAVFLCESATASSLRSTQYQAPAASALFTLQTFESGPS